MNETNNLVYSTEEINTLKTSLKLKINKIQERIEPLEICRNHTLIWDLLNI